MRISSFLNTAMKFVTPAQYTKSNLAHYNINTRAVNEFVKVHPALGKEDRLLDFGCGTGETTVAMSEGVLGQLGQPGKVVGVDISGDMISHCQARHKSPSTSFQQLDVSQGQSFTSSNLSSFSLLTSFSCLHWVPDQPAAVALFNKVLKPGGKFLFVIAGTQNVQKNSQRKVFEDMKTEERWRDLLKNTSWIHYKTVHVNNSWMSTVDQTGYGDIIQEDFVRLMEAKGFRVDHARTIPLEYKFDKDFIKNFFKQTIMTSFPALVGDKRTEFFNEYIPRVRELSTIDSDGYYDSNVDGIEIFGEKVKDI